VQVESPPPAPQPESPKLEFIPGMLLITGENISIPLPPGKDVILLGREDPVSGIFPDIDLDPHGGHDAGVGRRHAQIILRDNEVMIEDLDSVNGTVVNKQRLKSRMPQPIKHGDEIRLGKMVLIYMTS
jgi:pSer/pThr/pTyr-binding forkhead associated (FHA) protein